jgi:hypothetical protein
MDYKEAHGEIYGMFEDAYRFFFNEAPSFDWLYKYAEPHFLDWYATGSFPSGEDIDTEVFEYKENL